MPEVPAPVPGRVFTLGAVTTWRGGATAAYSLIHDDLCNDSVEGAFKHARPALKARDLHGGFGVIVKNCIDGERWTDVKALAAEGHDVFDHSWSHPCMTTDPGDAERCDPAAPKSANYAQEIEQSTKVLRESAGVPNLFFIFPYDVCAPAALAALKAQNYLGARCGDRMVALNESGFSDPFAVQFDVWGPAYSVYGQKAPCQGVEEYTTLPAATSPACRTAVLNRYVDDAIAAKGWAVREFHGFDDDKDSFEPLSVTDYEAHLDYLKARADEGKLWVEGPTDVVKYRFAREKCAAPTVSDNKLSFGTPVADCRKYATRLSYTVTTSDDPASLTSFQGGKLFPARKTGPRSFVVDADPTQGEATLQ